MKKILLLTVLFLSFHFTYAQCNKKVRFKCNKARDFKNGNIETELPIEATIAIDSNKISITASMNGQTETLEGEITEISACEWTAFLVNGKTQYKASIKKPNENTEVSLVDIVSENGDTKITFSSISDSSNKLQFDVSEYLVTEPPAPPAKEEPGKKKRKRKN